MAEDGGGVAFHDVEVVRDTGLGLMCRVGGRAVYVPPLRVLPGSTVRRMGDRGTLVLPLDVAEDLGLV
jgi:hypothetical protein